MAEAFWQGKRILVTGGSGFVGSHVVERLVRSRGVPERNIVVPRSQQYDLRQLEHCLEVMQDIQVVLHLAADVGGMGYSRNHSASQYYNSTLMDLHVMEAARRVRIKKMVAVSSSTAYPATALSPLQEEDLFNGLPYEAHLGYGYAKRALIVQAQVFHRQYGLNVAVVIANNAYGPRDNFDRATSHVVPATIRKCLEDSRLVVWGNGSAIRDLLYVEDLAEGVLLAAERLTAPHYLNLASGEEISIKRLIDLIVESTGFSGEVTFDIDKPGGEPRRVVKIDRARREIGFVPRWSLREGLARTVAWYRGQRG
jgi:GDP-L-fucose synthase